MLDENVKQRIVGAAVLVALAVIFLPSLFYKEERIEIDTSTQIPPSPKIEPVIIAQPIKPKEVDVPPSDQLFQPEFVETDEQQVQTILEKPEQEQGQASSGQAQAEKRQQVKKLAPKRKKVVEQPRLSSRGTPIAWVIQVASFKSQESAEKFVTSLLEKDFKAYVQAIETSKGWFYRVLIGPYIERQQAQDDQKTIEDTYKLQAKVIRFNPVSGD